MSQIAELLLEKVKKLPDNPGVYFFRDNTDATLYIGKATSLRDRVRSYFSNDLIKTRGQLLVDMVSLASAIDYIETDSVLEALILEANLIKKHQPKYNTRDKDNKSYNYIVFTDEAFPKVLTIRGRNLFVEKADQISEEFKYKKIFGPFPNGSQLKEAMKIIRRIFPYSDEKCIPYEEQIAKGRKPRPCFNRQIGLCPGICTGEISKEDYEERIKNLKLFFEGKKKVLLKNLDAQMKDHAKKQEFELAAETKRIMFALTHIQDVALLKRDRKMDESSGGEFASKDVFRIEAYDVAHISGTSVVGVMTVVEDGEINKSQYRKFKIKINPGVNDIAALKEILRRRLGHLEWPTPTLIVVDGSTAQINAAQGIIKKMAFSIDIVAVVKDEKHRPRAIIRANELGTRRIEHNAVSPELGRAILLANSEAHRFAIAYHRKKRDKIV